jgi:hypothetical protein
LRGTADRKDHAALIVEGDRRDRTLLIDTDLNARVLQERAVIGEAHGPNLRPLGYCVVEPPVVNRHRIDAAGALRKTPGRRVGRIEIGRRDIEPLSVVRHAFPAGLRLTLHPVIELGDIFADACAFQLMNDAGIEV